MLNYYTIYFQKFRDAEAKIVGLAGIGTWECELCVVLYKLGDLLLTLKKS